jgi:hypothetical protein
LGPFKERLADGGNGAIHVAQDELGGKSERSDTLLCKPNIALGVLLRMSAETMALAIDLNAELCAVAVEIQRSKGQTGAVAVCADHRNGEAAGFAKAAPQAESLLAEVSAPSSLNLADDPRPHPPRFAWSLFPNGEGF